MSATTYLFIANGIVWLGLAGYVGFLVNRAALLRARRAQLALLEEAHDHK